MTKPKKFIEKLNTSETLFGLDFGYKTIGIAVSDKSFTIASPITTIKRKGYKKDFDAIFIMRERTPITKSLISALPKLRYIMTSGMRNNAIDLETKESLSYKVIKK